MKPARKILVVDDEASVRALAGACIHHALGDGYEVLYAASGEEALAAAQQQHPDVVLLDILMPEMEGLETITELRRESPPVKVIAISGGGRIGPASYLRMAKMLGADRTFEKPVDTVQLLSTVEELLAHGEEG